MKEETRQERFRRIAERRMSRIFSNMNLIANLSSKKNYMYSNQEVNELFQAYMEKGKEIRKYFESPITLKITTNQNFKFSENNKENSVREDKEEKFRRVAENRMSRVFSDMSLIANLSNRKHYTYSVQEVDELFQAYEEKGIEIRAYFEPLKEEFTFSK